MPCASAIPARSRRGSRKGRPAWITIRFGDPCPIDQRQPFVEIRGFEPEARGFQIEKSPHQTDVRWATVRVAASELDISPSTVRRLIDSHEEEFGQSLVSRTSGGHRRFNGGLDGRSQTLLTDIQETEDNLATWVYFAANAGANQEDTITFAKMQNVVWRTARRKDGSLIPARRRPLEPGDMVLLVYRQPGPRIARVTATIAGTANAVLGTDVIERIEPPHSRCLLDAGARQFTTPTR